ncbi:MAG TPA: hypothetical protein ENI61_06430 [Ignavibacteria bacterium]|nr:hypothetical protein [Ignavibacteria bacterium]
MKNRLRRITWLDSFKIEEAHECHRISKICYEIVLQLDNLNDEPSSLVCINNVSSEDIDIFLDFPKHWRTVNLKNMINDVRPDIRKSGPISPIEQDRFAKQFIDVMED